MEVEKEEHAVIARRWTDELLPINSSGHLVSTTLDGNNALGVEEQRQLKQLYESPDKNSSSHQDFEVAEIAREQLQKIIDKFNEDSNPSAWRKSANVNVAEIFRKSMEGDISNLKDSVDGLEAEWKRSHGQVYAAFKKICSTLDDHSSILKVFPSQNNYTSPLVGSVMILMKAAKSHSDISVMLSKSIAEVSEKVATCSSVIEIVKTPRTRRKLAEIYARMFQFYQNAIEWYLQSKFGRFIRSFNENLVKSFEETKVDLEDSIKELYRETAVANTAMVAMINGKVTSLEAELRRQRYNYAAKDALAGQRMQRMMEATWMEIKQLESMIKLAALGRPREQSNQMQEVTTMHSTSNLLRDSKPNLDAFIIGNDGPALFDKGHFWVAEKDVLFKLRTWMDDNSGSRTLWISSPYERSLAVPSSRAAAMAMVAAAWQAETPIISSFCKRPRYDQLRPGLSLEQVGLISLVYGLIRQLLQFNRADCELEIEEKNFEALNGEESSWNVSLKVLRALLNHIPAVTFCVIDGLNDLELGEGEVWCKQLLNVLEERQQQTGTLFKILFSTAGQSLVLPMNFNSKDRYMTTKRAMEVGKSGKRMMF